MNTNGGSKKLTIAGIGLGAIVGTTIPTTEQSITAYCIKIVAIIAITLTAIIVQTWLDNRPQPE